MLSRVVWVGALVFGACSGSDRTPTVGSIPPSEQPDLTPAASAALGRFLDPNPVTDPAELVAPGAAIDFGDIDGDGDVDLALGAHACVLRNDGRGGFSVERLDVPASAWILFADLDGDGLDDVVTTHRAVLQRASNWVDETATWLTGDSAIAEGGAADFDGDGRVDLFVRASGMRLWHNTGTRLVDATDARLPAAEAWPPPRGPALGDIDGDGDVDALVHHKDTIAGLPSGGIDWLRNDGTGHFERVRVVENANAALVRLLDVGADGRLDLVWSEHAYHGDRDTARTYLRRFPFETERLVLAPDTATGSVSGDFDVDGDADLALQDSFTRSLRNEDARLHVAPTTWPLPSRPWSGNASLVDLDGDRDLDFVAPHAILWNADRHLVIPHRPSTRDGLAVLAYARDGASTQIVLHVATSALEPAPTPLGLWHLDASSPRVAEISIDAEQLAGTWTSRLPASIAWTGTRLLVQGIALGSTGATTNCVAVSIAN